MQNLQRRGALALLGLLPLAAQAQAPQEMLLFRVVGLREDVTVGFTEAELAALGAGAPAERIARRLAEAGQIGCWRYNVGRGPDGTMRYAATARIALMRQEAARIEPYRPALPVAPPPA